MLETENRRLMSLSKCALFGTKKLRFMKEQEVKGFLSNLSIKTLLSRIPILGDVLLQETFKFKIFLKFLKDKAFEIVNSPKYDGYQRGLASMIYKFFDKKSTGSSIKSMSNQQLANELHKPIIRKFKKRQVYSSFKDNILGVDLADMQLISKYNKRIRYLLCVIDLFTKYAWVVLLKDKK